MKLPGIAFAIAAAAVTGCQATTSSGSSRIRAISAEGSAFAPYRTFGFSPAGAPPFPYQVSARSFEVERRVRNLVATTLLRKGYIQAGTTPDFLVRLSSGMVEEDKLLPGGAGAYGGGKESVTSGEIGIDAFDGSTAQQVWHGTAQAEIDPERINELAIRSAVDQVLVAFPARSGASEQR
jgi:hypothetical protein